VEDRRGVSRAVSRGSGDAGRAVLITTHYNHHSTNPTQPNPTQPNPTQPNPTHPHLNSPYISVMHLVSARPPPSSWSTAAEPQVMRTISRWRCMGGVGAECGLWVKGAGSGGREAVGVREGGWLVGWGGRGGINGAPSPGTIKVHAASFGCRIMHAHPRVPAQHAAQATTPMASITERALTRSMQSVPVCQSPTLVILRAASTIFSAFASDSPLTACSRCIGMGGRVRGWRGRVAGWGGPSLHGWG